MSRPLSSDHTCGPVPPKAGRRRTVGFAALPLIALLGAGVPLGHAAGLNPLPATASALSKVSSYQVVVTTTASGMPTRRPNNARPPGYFRGNRRGGGGLGFFGGGKQVRTITAVRKGSAFEEYVVTQGTDQAGKKVTNSIVVYAGKICSQNGSGHAYTCQTSNFAQNIDPTDAFAQGAGSTTFTHAASKTIGGQVCLGYAYLNQSQYQTAKGVVYIGSKTNLPCEQDATITRQMQGGAKFTQTPTTVWSRFNDHKLSVPAIPLH